MLSLSPVHHQHEAAERLLAEKRELLCDLSDERDRFTALRHRLEELDSSSTRHRSRRSGATVPAEAKGATVADRAERLLQLLSSSTSASSASIDTLSPSPSSSVLQRLLDRAGATSAGDLGDVDVDELLGTDSLLDIIDELQQQKQGALSERDQLAEQLAVEAEEYDKHVSLLSEMLAEEKSTTGQLRKDLCVLEVAYQTEVEQAKIELDDYKEVSAQATGKCASRV